MNISEWKEKFNQNLTSLFFKTNAGLPRTAYGAISAAALIPLVDAFMAGGSSAFWAAAGPVLGGVGSSLLANQMQRLADQQTEAPSPEAFAHQLAIELRDSAGTDEDLRDALDELNQQVESITLTRQNADDEQLAWLTQTLRTELAQIGNLEKYAGTINLIENSGSGSIAVGNENVISGDSGISANTMNQPVNITGENAQVTITPNPPEPEKPDYLTTYLHALQTECDALPLAAMGKKTDGLDEDVSLRQIYINLDTTAREQRSQKEQINEHTLQHDEAPPIKALEAVAQHKYVLLLGDPGSGKSTFVRHLTIDYAEKLLNKNDAPLPIFVVLNELIQPLRDLADQVNLEELNNDAELEPLRQLFVDEWTRKVSLLRAEGFAPQLLEKAEFGRVFLVLDGIDEVPESLRNLLFRAIYAVAKGYRGIEKIVATCRVRSHHQEMLPEFEAYTLASFNDEQISKFVDLWYSAQIAPGIDPATVREQIEDLQRAALDKDKLDDLPSNPMMLTTMAIVHQSDTVLPDRRVELYQQAVDVLMIRWQRRRGNHPVSAELAALLRDPYRLRPLLEAIAYTAHKKQSKDTEQLKDSEQPNEESTNRSALLTRAELIALLEERDQLGARNPLIFEFLDYIDYRAGLFVGRGGGRGDAPSAYSFPHRTFQEYLAGCYIAQEKNRNRVSNVYKAHAMEGDYWQVAALFGAEEIYFNQRKNVDLLDLIYQLAPLEAPQNENDWRALLWSSQIATIVERTVIESDALEGGGQDYLNRVKNFLAQLPHADHGLSITELAEAGQALGQIGDPRSGVSLKHGLPDIDWIPIEAGSFIMGTDPNKDENGYNWEEPQFTCTLITEPYHISRYPVTVAQYQPFVQAGGYTDSNFWTAAGWAWRESNQVDGPQTYRQVFQTPNHPQVGVSWYEAIAFCNWLSHELGTEITLPSEAQWERAARHTDGLIYPWTGPFDAQKCNMAETGIGHTSAVGLFPSGNAKCGASDMAGNVLEWTTTKWTDNYEDYHSQVDNALEGDAARVWRGGSWGNFRQLVRCAYRYYLYPLNRDGGLGFRLLAPSL